MQQVPVVLYWTISRQRKEREEPLRLHLQPILKVERHVMSMVVDGQVMWVIMILLRQKQPMIFLVKPMSSSVFVRISLRCLMDMASSRVFLPFSVMPIAVVRVAQCLVQPI